MDTAGGVDIKNDAGFYREDNIRHNIINLSDTLVLDGRARIKSVEYDPNTGRPIKVSDNPEANLSSYVIQPKWETPMFNFNDKSAADGTATHNTLSLATNASASHARGMWHQFGLPPDAPDKGIFLQAADIPKEWLESHPVGSDTQYNTGSVSSLVDLMGLDQTPRRLGEVSSGKEVSEAIVAVPFIEGESEKEFFSIPESRIADALAGKLGADNSVQQMVDSLQNYVLPPKMDFLTNKTVKPFAMYVFEFKHVFDKDDLTHIWQNLPPKAAVRAEKQKATISHKLLQDELLGVDGLPSKVKWMVFKIKKKAVKNYFSKVPNKQGDNLNDKKFKFEFEIAGRKSELDYSYNWPYDFFSLVEMVKIDAEVEFHGVDE